MKRLTSRTGEDLVEVVSTTKTCCKPVCGDKTIIRWFPKICHQTLKIRLGKGWGDVGGGGSGRDQNLWRGVHRTPLHKFFHTHFLATNFYML